MQGVVDEAESMFDIDQGGGVEAGSRQGGHADAVASYDVDFPELSEVLVHSGLVSPRSLVFPGDVDLVEGQVPLRDVPLAESADVGEHHASACLCEHRAAGQRVPPDRVALGPGCTVDVCAVPDSVQRSLPHELRDGTVGEPGDDQLLAQLDPTAAGVLGRPLNGHGP